MGIVECLGWKRPLDPSPLWRLRRLLQSEAYDLVHVWGLMPLRVLGLVGRRWLSRTLVSGALPSQARTFGRLDRWLLNRTHAVVATCDATAEQFRKLGVAAERLVVIPPGVEIATAGSGARSAIVTGDLAWRIVCVGSPPTRQGFRDAIWAADILRYVFPSLRLTIVADAAERPYLQWFAECIQIGHQLEFIGRHAGDAAALAQADVCWIPTAAGDECQLALQAMAAGCPVLATDQPGLRDLIVNGDTGYLVPGFDKVTMCKRTRGLFVDPALVRQQGAAARQRVCAHFHPAACVERWADAYRAAA
jgi:glycosyltransferase involved in cell wall biosynthesis